MGTVASQITSLMIVYSIVYSDTDQRKRQSAASLVFVRGITNGQLRGKCFHLMTSSWYPISTYTNTRSLIDCHLILSKATQLLQSQTFEGQCSVKFQVQPNPLSWWHWLQSECKNASWNTFHDNITMKNVWWWWKNIKPLWRHIPFNYVHDIRPVSHMLRYTCINDIVTLQNIARPGSRTTWVTVVSNGFRDFHKKNNNREYVRTLRITV